MFKRLVQTVKDHPLAAAGVVCSLVIWSKASTPTALCFDDEVELCNKMIK